MNHPRLVRALAAVLAQFLGAGRWAWLRLRVAAGFLTLVPMPGRPPADLDLAAATPLFPVVGMALGAAQALLLFPYNWWSDANLAGPLAFGMLVVGTVLTAGLHLDGLADTFDGLFGGQSPEERLRILKDPHHGTFGILALVLVLVGKYAGLAALLSLHSQARSAAMLVLAPALARWSMVSLAGLAAAAPGSTLGRLIAGRVPPLTAVAGLTAPTALGLLVLGWAILPAIVIASAVPVLMARAATRRLGGVTGDVFGATSELVEVGVYLLFAFLR